ncbi:hypothetical protein ABNQ39_20855 [Azospirillum sp. A26]|uniref:hypothetical protein n=1 Tax=unclassified Azospirillum TaxID=2630922 RepID=UPI0011B54EA6|nr:hypothetical protein [Azospirillum sp. TSA6c]
MAYYQITAPRARNRTRNTMLDRFLVGLGGLVCFAAPVPPYRIPHRSARDAMRSDWRRLGLDLRRVMERRYEAIKEVP